MVAHQQVCYCMYNLGARREFHVRFLKGCGVTADREGARGFQENRASPATDRTAIDVDKTRSGIIADATALQAEGRFAHLL
jgi:hypothetical protein